MPQNICIFFPDKNIGGGPYWLMRIANELSKDENYKVFYIDYKDGFAHKIPEAEQSDKVKFIEWNACNNKFLFGEECILFMPIYDLNRLPLIYPESKVLFFNWHTECLPVLKRRLGTYDADILNFLALVYANKSQVFCDGSHLDYMKKTTGIPFEPKFVPLIANLKDIHAKKEIIKDDEINIALLGRIVIDKIYALNNIIRLASEYKTDRKVIIHIIGDGWCKDSVTTEVPDNVQVRFCGVIRDEALNEYLRDNCDVMFAMGTSVCEGAAMKLPSYIIPTDVKPIECDKFVFLPNTKDFITGYLPEQADIMGAKIESFKDIIDNLLLPDQKMVLGEECYRYIEQNCTPEASVELLKKHLNETTLQFKDVYLYKKCMNLTCAVSPIYNIRKVTNRIQTKFRNKLRYFVYKQCTKSIPNGNDIENFKKKHPIKYKIWRHYDKKLRKKDLI